MRYALLIILGMLLGMLTGGWLLERCSALERGVEWRVFIDTIPYVDPAPVDSQPVRHDVVKLPVVKPKCVQEMRTVSPDSIADVDTVSESVLPDSATVAVPITQYEYADSMYCLRVSGYHVAVDELTIYPRREVSIIKQPPRRWHVGLSAGYGATPRGLQPLVALTLTYSLFSF